MTTNAPNVQRCKSILIIEDDEGIRATLRLMLEIEGYRIATAGNGKEGLEQLPRMERPCLILLDLMMPVMNGWEFMQVLEKDMILATIPVVIVTAYGTRGIETKAQGLIKKPIKLDELLSIVKQYCADP